MKDAADAKGVPLSKDESREAVYGMPYEEWKAKHQKEASPEQQAAFEKATSTELALARSHLSSKTSRDALTRDEVAVHGCG